MTVDTASAIDEQPHCCRAGQFLEARICPLQWQGERVHAPHQLSGHRKRQPARRQDAKLKTGAEELQDQPADRIGQVLAVVEDQQELRVSEPVDDGRGKGYLRVGGDAQHSGYGRDEPLTVRSVGQVHEPGPVRQPARQASRHFLGQTGLAHPSRTGQGHQGMAQHRLGQADQLLLTPEKRAELATDVGPSGPARGPTVGPFSPGLPRSVGSGKFWITQSS